MEPIQIAANGVIAPAAQLLKDHLTAAERHADRFAHLLGLPEPERSAVRLAAAWHDLGKARPLWHASIGNRPTTARPSYSATP